MSRKSGLGKGLDALIPGGEDRSPEPSGVRQIPIDNIQANPRQPRSEFDPSLLQELAKSISEHGVLQPLIVSERQDNHGFQLIVGERRWQAARMAGLTTVPAIVRQADEIDQVVLALIENIQRSDLNPLEAADGYRQLADEFNLSHEAIAELVAKSRAAISNTLRLLKLSAAVRKALAEGQISEGHARALLGLSSAQAQNAALQTVISGSLSVRQTEDLVRKLRGQRKRKKRPSEKAPELADLEEKLRQSLGTRVTLKRSARGGSIQIHFYSDEELDELIQLLLGDSA